MLEEYKRKRNFKKTPEPQGGNPKKAGELWFVIQKHHASHLHYDFRLELKGVLKSWAVPKGPSMNPVVKRLAMHVEDHPWDYRNFEGIIPSGYGKGTVIVWDQGYYGTPRGESASKKDQEKALMKQYREGKMVLRLHGEKVKGDFALFRVSSRGENAWLLQKMEDDFATKKEISKLSASELSGRTLDEVAQDAPPEGDMPAQSAEDSLDELLKLGKKKPMPK